MDYEEYLKELLKWVSSDSILVIDKKGALRRIYCPFEAICIVMFPDIKEGDKVAIEAVKITVTLKEVYIIKGKAYFIIFFRIIL